MLIIDSLTEVPSFCRRSTVCSPVCIWQSHHFNRDVLILRVTRSTRTNPCFAVVHAGTAMGYRSKTYWHLQMASYRLSICSISTSSTLLTATRQSYILSYCQKRTSYSDPESLTKHASTCLLLRRSMIYTWQSLMITAAAQYLHGDLRLLQPPVISPFGSEPHED